MAQFKLQIFNLRFVVRAAFALLGASACASFKPAPLEQLDAIDWDDRLSGD